MSSANPSKHDLNYRADIDGLRAVSVISVILYHLDSSIVRGGFAGVDVFFVISGFLITSIVRTELDRGIFSFAHFYERRARRLLPALFVVIVVSFIVGWACLLPSELQDFSQSVVAVLTGTANVFFWIKRHDYFNASTDSDVMLHTWSLSVEEQFYIFLPLLLARLKVFSARTRSLVFGSLSLGSFFLTVAQPENDPGATFFLLHTRAWELGAGALLSCWPSSIQETRISTLCSSLGFASLLAFLVVGASANQPWPGVMTIVPVLSTCLVIHHAAPTNPIRRLLSAKPLVGIGMTSYSAYLWHQPIFVIGRLRFPQLVDAGSAWVLVPCSLIIGALSWRYVEQPFRRSRRRSTTAVLRSTAVLCGLGIAAGTCGHRALGWPNRLPVRAAQLAQWTEWSGRVHDPETGDWLVPEAARCWDNFDSAAESVSTCTWGPSGAPMVAVWGDSHSRPLAWELSRALKTSNIRVQQLSRNACAPVEVTSAKFESKACKAFRAEALEYLLHANDCVAVVIASRWTSLWRKDTSPTQDAEVAQQIQQMTQQLVAAGRKVVLIGTVPTYSRDVPRYAARSVLWKDDLETAIHAISIRTSDYLETTSKETRALAALQSESVLLVHPLRTFCDRERAGYCEGLSGEQPLYFDDNHLNTYGARQLVRQLLASAREKWPNVLPLHNHSRVP